ncbi:hypothetical protein B0181_07710 [Moraxella caviae]|uniref:tRNA 5-methylaminomethyl-2-thiouridine biosynthesis bifunctional protein MnmC n=1 Tax=Moraxella caviae TaxID=34060 RepID=A0A1S9ZZ90_9GAMM|nr:FAD-dependent 5-carboxymethylaminomethyl-2-thiouridine(34) oxidoreductase MnmC [Moraxella caviae]OOR88773.1 hypothetical protein B0181_07710 [Moraxella caviae]STZ14865.1 tRNA 5-methylaminomethyl-2-thiouridine biosynthesis bifunctional protein MnmC [Moraxella caviae]VEW13654.1 tRNA 5-methylaminomethyl-2-thiouridine biosynthesis bifunctional protein MnmC [Moraxella caviae]
MSAVSPAKIHWQTDHSGQVTPFSPTFDDVYFSHAGGLDESRYVFLQGNRLLERLANLATGKTFTVGETGFGTGLNFLALCELWQTLKSCGQLAARTRLHFVSTEKFPLTKDDLRHALAAWRTHLPQLTPFIDALIAQYPLPMAGCHRLLIADDITLDLWLGDATDSLRTFGRANGGKVDAWFLDGFAPSKNSDLWSDELFLTLKNASRPDATLATFTAAGFVRRGLAAAGFIPVKQKGFGRKREMLTAHLPAESSSERTEIKHRPNHVAIVGAGVSGLCTALALAQRGIKITLIDKSAPIAGASGNPRALLAPKLSLLDGAHSHLPTVSFLFAERFYRWLNGVNWQDDNTLDDAYQDKTDQTVCNSDNLCKSTQSTKNLAENSTKTPAPIFTQTGVMDFLLPTQKSSDKLHALVADYPDELIYSLDDKPFSAHAINAIVPSAGLVSPKNLAAKILAHPHIHFVKAAITDIQEHDDGVRLTDSSQIICADKAIICAGFESHLLADVFNCRKIRGQVSWLNVAQHDGRAAHLPSTPIKYDGYCAAFSENGAQTLLIGASFVRNRTDTDVRTDEHEFNLQKFTHALPEYAQALDIKVDELGGRASIRAQTPDYHPLVGQIAGSQHRYALYGMGSKGFSFAPLCAQIMAALLCDEVLPIDDDLLAKLSPARPRLQTPLTDNC